MRKLILGILLIPCWLWGQSTVEEGLELMKASKYVEAHEVFASLAAAHPEDKGVRLLYGRALGLSGSTQKAVTHFQALNKEFPNDKDMMLNLADAFMWNKEFESAIAVFQRFFELDSMHFGSRVGNANAHAALKRYVPALDQINRALAIKSGDAYALTTKKNILLGKAYVDKEAGKYASSHQYLDSLLNVFQVIVTQFLTKRWCIFPPKKSGMLWSCIPSWSIRAKTPMKDIWDCPTVMFYSTTNA